MVTKLTRRIYFSLTQMPFEIIFLELPTRTHAAYKRVGLLLR